MTQDMRRKMILTIIIAYLVILFDCKIEYTNNSNTYKLDYNGLLWVGLDYYLKLRYDNTYVPMRWVKWTKE